MRYKRLILFLLFLNLVLILIIQIGYFPMEFDNVSDAHVIPPIPDRIESTIKLYFIQNGKLVQELRTIISENLEIEREIVKELIKGPRNKLYEATLPANTTILSIETIDNICYVNLSKNYLNYIFDSGKDSALIVWSLVNSLTQLDYIHKVQLLIDGKRVSLIINNHSLKDPLPRNEELVQLEDETPYKFIKQFLRYIKEKRYDKAYEMIDKESKRNIRFLDFIEYMDKYINSLHNFNVYLYNTKKFNSEIILTIIYASEKYPEGEIYEDWKLTIEDGEWKINLNQSYLIQ